MADHIRFEASFSKLDTAVQEFVATLQEQLVVYKAEGDEVRAAQVQARIGAVQGPGVSRTAPQVAEANAALTRENALKRAGQVIDVETLDTIRAQNQARLEQLAIVDRLQATPERAGAAVIMPAGAGPGGTYARAQARQQAELNAELRYYNEELAQEPALRERSMAIEAEQLALDQRRAEAMVQQQALVEGLTRYTRDAQAAGLQYGAAGQRMPAQTRAGFMAGPRGLQAGEWGAQQAQLVKLNAAMGEYAGFATRDNLSTAQLNANLTRLGISSSEASTAMRRHGALTTEWLQALARGETTIQEFGYQIGATVAKFAGWTIAAGATYAALGAVYEFGKGAIDASSGVQQLTRTIENLNRAEATRALEGLSQATNVPIKEAADATFLYSRTFHNLADAVTAARNGLSVFKLDNVALQDSMRLSTSIFQQFGLNAQQQSTMWNMLAAGQREYNARISETVPALRASTGAVKNAGGDLTQLIQLTTLAARIYPGIPGQIGTAFARGSATYTPKNLPQLRQQFGIGYGEEGTNWTQLMIDAIQKSATMSGPQRRQLAGLIFDPRYGSRIAGLFGPQAAATLGRITGTGPEAITPGATRGALQTELSRELGSIREQLHSFTNEMQRMGASIGASGLVQLFGHLIGVFTGVGSAVRGVVDTFDHLPNTAKQLLEVGAALRTLQLLTSRTRWGSSLADATGMSRLPGFGAGAADRASQTLRVGTRAAMAAVQQDIEASTQAFLRNGARQVELERQKAVVQNAINQEGGATEANYTRSNAISERIEALQAEQNVIEERYNAQLEALSGLKTQQNMLRRGPARGGFTDEQTLALNAAVTKGTIGASAGTESEGAAATGDTAAQGKLAALKMRAAGLLGLNAVATEEAAGAMEADAVAARIAQRAAAMSAASAEANIGAASGLSAGLSGLVASIDPWMVALIGLPLLYSQIKSGFDKAGAASKSAAQAQDEATRTIADYQKKAADLAAAAEKQRKAAEPTGLAGFVNQVTLGLYADMTEANAKSGIDKTSAQQQSAQKTVLLYQPYLDRVRQDIKTLSATEAGRQRILAEIAQLQADAPHMYQLPGGGLDLAKAITTGMKGLGKVAGDAIKNIRVTPNATPAEAFLNSLGDLKAEVLLVGAVGKGAHDFLSTLEQLSAKQLKQAVQAYGARSTVYGLDTGQMKKAAETFLFSAARYRGSTNQQDLASVTQAQEAFTNAVNKNVQDLLNAAKNAPTRAGQMGGLTRAVGEIQSMRAGVQQWARQMEAHFRQYPSIVKAIAAAAAQLDNTLGSQLSSTIQQQLQLIQTQGALAASRIQGISPQADIARAQATLAALIQALALARKEGADWQTIAGLLTQIGTAQQQIFQQKIQNADAIAQAREQLSSASIIGVGPGADMARAQQNVSNAANDLARDKREGKGLAQILTDQAALDSAQQALMQQAQSNAQTAAQDASALIQAQSDLQQSMTTDPIKQAREQLAADLQILGTISPSGYSTYSEYQAAYIEQQAKVAKDKQNVTQQIVSTDMATLQFELHTQQITEQQYVAGLQKLLHMKKLSLQDRQQILTEIFDATHQAVVSLNLGDIQMPTTYEVRRAIQGAMRGRWKASGGGGGDIPTSTTNNSNVTNHISIVVHKNADLHEFARILDDTLKSNFAGTAQAMGLI